MLGSLYSVLASFALAMFLFLFTGRRTLGMPSVVGVFIFGVTISLHIAYETPTWTVTVGYYLAGAGLLFDVVRMILRGFKPRKTVF